MSLHSKLIFPSPVPTPFSKAFPEPSTNFERKRNRKTGRPVEMTALEASLPCGEGEGNLTWLSEHLHSAGAGGLKSLVSVGKLSTAMSLPHPTVWPAPHQELLGQGTIRATKQREPGKYGALPPSLHSACLYHFPLPASSKLLTVAINS